MKKQQFLLTVVLAVCSLLATTTTAAVAKDTTTRQHGNKAVKKPVKKPVNKQAKKPVGKKPALQAGKPAPKPAQPIAAAQPSTDVQQRITKAGDYRFAIQHGGLARTYRVHVPARYTPDEPAPLLVALHGGADRVSEDGLEGLTRESDYNGFIAVFPEGYAPPGKGRKATWNAGNCCGDAREQQVNDVGFIEQVVNNVFRQVSVDRQRIYAAGMSDGGMMAYRLACDLPYVFKAVASVGGTDNTATCTPERSVSVMHFHAKDDPRVPFPSAPATAAKWAHLNGCSEKPRRVLDTAGAYCEAYSYCRSQAEVQLCVTDTGGHSWPGGKARPGAEPPSQAIQATQAMWGFLSAH